VRAAAAATFRTLPRAALRLPPTFRRRLIAVLALAAVLGAVYLFWFRDSSFVQVEKVTVTGLTTHEAPEIRAALTRAGRGMTTLDLDVDTLRRAVGGNPIVHSISATPQFPHGLRIEVVENVPRAWLVGAGGRVPVAGNGTVLPEQTVSGNLPAIQLSGALVSGRVDDRATASLVSVAAAAPAGIVHKLSRITRQAGKGIVVQLRGGPPVYFGEATQLEAKWADAVAILADHGSQGAAYVDVRMPDRPVAGGLHIDVSPPPSPTPGASSGAATAAPPVTTPAAPAAPAATTTPTPPPAGPGG
jgi:cell division protein FtsQ